CKIAIYSNMAIGRCGFRRSHCVITPRQVRQTPFAPELTGQVTSAPIVPDWNIGWFPSDSFGSAT
ncbi:hypothetical protein ACIHFD_66980, partial [Nonomuraea sp. NPDC051941]|uniref:hypothetical protein n=1 Tax=Nonomuraea sp. NPDC051941 TaxID=3364373 RepID=UPI0037CCB564